ncbi:MAG: S-methyl-5'-thioadenosine phosphorylase [Deltaproteobacteria bacterium]|nr:S-methyl-5'-thioadenosine phosphorylase [Deltaproteobacteria bacterium]
MAEKAIGIIGGSGLYDLEGVTKKDTVRIHTPFGDPSDDYHVGELDGRTVVFLPRHGRGHRLLPSELNYRANIHGFLQLGCDWLLSVSAVGSMREELRPGDVVVVDQFFDWTRGRVSSFFGEGVVAHLSLADPVCDDLANTVYSAAKSHAAANGSRVQKGGTYLCIEGPQFSTRAESTIYRSWGVDVIGMTNMPEAKLAREAGICYATLAMITDYDCWHEEEEDVTVESVIETLNRNVAMAKSILVSSVRAIDIDAECKHRHAANGAVMTASASMNPETRERLALILDRAK